MPGGEFRFHREIITGNSECTMVSWPPKFHQFENKGGIYEEGYSLELSFDIPQ